MPPPQRVRVADRGAVYLNGRWNPCTVLAVLSDRGLVEYTMLSGCTALAFIDALAIGAGPNGLAAFTYVEQRPCGYRQLLKPWLVAVVRQYGAWLGRSKTGAVPGPLVVLRKRFPRAAKDLR